MQALRSAYYLIATGNEEAVIAGGADSFSAAPFVLRDVRYSFNEKNRVIYDTVTEGEMWTQPDPILREEWHRELADSEGISIDDEQQYVEESMRKARIAQELHSKHVAPVVISDRKRGDIVIDTDEYLSLDLGKRGLPTIAPYADGAAAALVMSEERAVELGYRPLARIRRFAAVGCSPRARQNGAPKPIFRSRGPSS